MGIEGSLTIRLEIGRNTVDRVRIESSRPVHASRVFAGKGIADTLHLIPRLFSICATAQACAAVRACEQALGLQSSATIEHLRDLLVNMETLREHLWRILLDWPAFIDRDSDKSAVAEAVALERTYQQALCPGANLFHPKTADCHPDLASMRSVADSLADLLQQSVFSMPATEWLKFPGEEALVHWASSRETIAARLIDQVVRADWSGAGACASMALPTLTETRLHQALQDKAFIEQPQWSGQCCESSSLVRIDSPLLRSLKREHGNGLLVRVIGRLTELAQLGQRLLPEESESGVDRSGSSARVHNPGIGQDSAARGQLVHRIELTGNRVASYQILAPTEWNFHPQGVVSRALSSLQGEPDEVERQARLLINAIDPCVGYELRICPGKSVDA